jgi:hypothetical protein
MPQLHKHFNVVVRNQNANNFRITTKTLNSWIIFKDEKFIEKGRKIYSLGNPSWILTRTARKNKQW